MKNGFEDVFEDSPAGGPAALPMQGMEREGDYCMMIPMAYQNGI